MSSMKRSRLAIAGALAGLVGIGAATIPGAAARTAKTSANAGAGAAAIPGATDRAARISAQATTTKTTTTSGPKTLGGTVVLGGTKTPVAPPVCPKGVSPANCTIIMTRATGLETIRDGIDYPTTVKQDGEIVAFQVGLANLSSDPATDRKDISFLDSKYGGTTRLQLTILKLTDKRKREWTVEAQSPTYHVQPYLGYTTQFVLKTPLPVTRGETVALTVPTWAPILSYNLPTKQFAYRQSRRANCTHPGGQQNAVLTIGQAKDYKCDYPGTRVEYNATELVTVVPPKNFVH
jgi:hypothetical protein